MLNFISRYMHWLHTRWPAGTVEKLPEVNEDGTTAVPGLRVVGDLTGIPLLKFASQTGSQAVRDVLAESNFQAGGSDAELYDLVIVGGGVAGISAAIEAQNQGLRYLLFEASENFSTIVNFPKGKPIFTYPTDMKPEGGLQFSTEVKEALIEEMEAQRVQAGVEPTRVRVERIERKGGELLVHRADKEVTRAKRVIVAIGRSGNFRKLGVPGEGLDKVYNRLHDPKTFSGQDVLIVGGGDTALEAAIALANCGANVTLSYRKPEFSRPKPENIEKLRALEADPSRPQHVEHPTSERVTTSMPAVQPGTFPTGSVRLAMATQVKEIRDDEVEITHNGGERKGEVETLRNQVVFSMIGREPPLDFFRRSGVPIRGEWRAKTWASFSLFMLFCIWMYHWKSGGAVYKYFEQRGWFPFQMTDWLKGLVASAGDPANLLGTLALTLKSPGFYYSVAYCACVVIFGIRRIQRRKTPYVKVQTLSLMAFQVVPLFLLPYIVLPWLGHNGFWDSGAMKTFADNFFPVTQWDPQGREYWRAFGFVLAWPLFVWNFFTHQPMWGWLIVGGIQTFVIIPLLIWRFGKGAYCGWICSCGALAETLGDSHRQKMPHGPLWNRVNMVGQVALWTAVLLMILRIFSWVSPGSAAGAFAAKFYGNLLSGWFFSYYYIVDLWLAGIVGVGFYFWFSGRTWCRFACPLAALMHIYARFSRFRIFADKKKCISCNVCTSVCHQGIDIMNFANKGLPMEDPECVRCSACVQSCPTGTLTFGHYGPNATEIPDSLPASLVQMAEQSKRA